jgi:hypothetical protein
VALVNQDSVPRKMVYMQRDRKKHIGGLGRAPSEGQFGDFLEPESFLLVLFQFNIDPFANVAQV